MQKKYVKTLTHALVHVNADQRCYLNYYKLNYFYLVKKILTDRTKKKTSKGTVVIAVGIPVSFFNLGMSEELFRNIDTIHFLGTFT